MSTVGFSVNLNISRPLLLERGLLLTLLFALIADYCEDGLPFTDAWVFFCLVALSLGSQRLVTIGFAFGSLTLFTDIFFLALVSRSPAANAFSAFEYLGKLFCTYTLYYYLRVDLGGVLSLSGEPVTAQPVEGAGVDASAFSSSGFSASSGGEIPTAPVSPYGKSSGDGYTGIGSYQQ